MGGRSDGARRLKRDFFVEASFVRGDFRFGLQPMLLGLAIRSARAST